SPTVVAASIADGRTGDSSMRFAAVRGRGSGTSAQGAAGREGSAQLPTSSSTRHPGLLQVTDLAPTLLTTAGVTGAGGVAGSPLRFESGPTDAAGKVQLMLDRQTAVQTQESVSAWFYAVWGILLIGLLVVCTIVARRRGIRRIATAMTIGGLF